MKNILRLKAKKIRKTLDTDNLSTIAVNKIQNLDIYKNSSNVLIFYPKKYEINLLNLLKDNKNFYLPKVCAERIFICPFKPGEKLVKSCFGVNEPCTDFAKTNILDLIILPALMADSENYRLGYGGGFYDRFLAENKNIPTILPVAKELYIEHLPRESHDIKADLVIVC